MTTLAAASDLIAADGYSADDIAGALSWATGVIEGYCNRTLALVTGETVVLTPRNGGGILPNYPVAQVTLVEGYLPSETGGMAWQAMTNYWLVAETGALYNTAGLPGSTWNGRPSWPWIPGSLRVTYDHGYDPVPSDLVGVCARLAGQYLENPKLMLERRVGDMEGRFSGSAGVLFGPLDLAIIDGYSNVGVG